MEITKTKSVPEMRDAEKPRTEPPWNVVLHNDWSNSMPKVVVVLVRLIPGMTIKKATALMWQAHSQGQATVKRCHKELAELYAERLGAAGLMVSIQPSE